jgi:hypothetical protein
MRRLILALVVLALGACGSRPTGVPERDLQWRTSLRGDQVQLVVFDRTGEYRITSVSLVGPSGQVVPARELTRENQGSGGGGTGVGVFGSGGSRGMGGIGMGIELPVGSDTPSLERRTSAVIPLPPAYRENAAQWRVQVEMVLPNGTPYRVTLAAPT